MEKYSTNPISNFTVYLNFVIVKYVMKSQDKLIQQLSSSIESGFFMHENLKLHYIKTGKGNPLILLHGATMGWGQWVPNIDSLAQSFTVFALDLPGAGLSTKIDFQKYSFNKAFIDSIIQFIHYYSLTNIRVIGHSTGGLIACHLVSSLPQVKSVVLVNPVGLGGKTPLPFRLLSLPGFASLLTKVLIGKSKKKLKFFLTEPLYQKKSISDTFVDYVFESSSSKEWLGPLHLISIMTSLKGIKKKFMALDKIGKTDKKILLIWGQYDDTFDLKEVQENIKFFPHVRLSIMKDTAHVPNMERSKEFNEIVLPFLEK